MSASYLYYWKALGPQRLSERNKVAVRGQAVPRQEVLPRLPVRGRHRRFDQGSDRAAAYWFNQHVIDNVLNYTGRGAAALGRVTYKYVDQKGVDGIVNGIGVGTGEAGGAVRQIQTGRLQFYALMLVLAVGLFALLLWIAA